MDGTKCGGRGDDEEENKEWVEEGKAECAKKKKKKTKGTATLLLLPFSSSSSSLLAAVPIPIQSAILLQHTQSFVAASIRKSTLPLIASTSPRRIVQIPLMKDGSQQDTGDDDSSPFLRPPELHELETTEVDDVEQDQGSAACCRICLESDSSNPEGLISPCMCKGTQQFVHRECLDHWRSVKEGFAFSHCTTCKAQFHLHLQISEDNSWRKAKFRLLVARDVILVFLALQGIIASLALAVYLVDLDGQFRNSFSNGWDRWLLKHPAAFYYCAGVFMFFAILGIVGLVVHCCSGSNNDPCMAGSRHCCYGWGIPASVEACGVLLVIFVVVFAIFGIAYGLLAATLTIQRIWQRHYHILTKRELTKEYIVQDLHGNYSPPKLDPEHEEQLKALKLI